MRSIIILLLFASLTSNETTDNEVSPDDDDEKVERPLVVHSVDKNPGLPKETQMAQCTVQSGDIKASAQATFSKKLEGFCSTDDMKVLKETLLDIETRLYRDIYNLQKLVESVLPSNARHYYQPPPPPPPPRDYYQQRNYDNQEQETTTRRMTTTTAAAAPPPPPSEKGKKIPVVINANKLKSLESGHKKQKDEKPKVEETTTAKINPKTEYTYYWKLDQFPKVFENSRKHEVFSHVFNVKGLFLRIRANMNYQDSENLLLDIEHLANVENSHKMEIEVSDGLVFKEIAEEKLFQYSFAILNQANPNDDLISPLYWNNENENFLIPNSIHLLSSYIKEHSILIKLIISF